MQRLIKLRNLILDILFPPICINCHSYLEAREKSEIICGSCLSKIQIHTTLFCGTCRARLPENKKICHKNTSYLLGAATNYNDPLVNLIHYFKYQSWKRIGKKLGDLLLAYLKNLSLPGTFLKNFVVVPIPLHKNRKRIRGFNQAEFLANIIASYYQLPIVANTLIRTKETKSQSKLKDWSKRAINVQGAFVISNPDAIKKKKIILVDDVYTSGATVKEVVRVLKENGAGQILVLVLAKSY